MNRLSESARAAIDFNPLSASSFQSRGIGSRRKRVSKLPANDLIGASGWADELIILVPTAILLVLVLVLGRDDRNKAVRLKKDRP